MGLPNFNRASRTLLAASFATAASVGLVVTYPKISIAQDANQSAEANFCFDGHLTDPDAILACQKQKYEQAQAEYAEVHRGYIAAVKQEEWAKKELACHQKIGDELNKSKDGTIITKKFGRLTKDDINRRFVGKPGVSLCTLIP